MLHEWFMHFGGIAILLAVAGYIVTRVLTGKPENAEDRGGAAIGFFFVGAIAAVFLVLALFAVLFGFSGTYLGWIGFAIAGASIGIGTRAG